MTSILDDEMVEYILLQPIADAFLEKYPDERYGRAHAILDDGNFEYRWITALLQEMATERIKWDNQGDAYDDPLYILLETMMRILQVLGLDDDQT